MFKIVYLRIKDPRRQSFSESKPLLYRVRVGLVSRIFQLNKGKDCRQAMAFDGLLSCFSMGRLLDPHGLILR